MNYYQKVKNFRKTFRKVALGSMGRCCQICGYSKCNKALELHHIDPTEKETNFTKIISWDRLYNELEKCILLCANCHREIHDEVVELPLVYSKFDKTIADSLRSNASLYSQRSTHEERRIAKENFRIKREEQRINNIEERRQKILTSGIDLTRYGWASKLAVHIGIERPPLIRWMKAHMPDVYANCNKSSRT